MENTEEKIKEMAKLLHSFSNAEMKQKIEQWFPECLKQKLEAGKWYKHFDSDCKEFLFCFNEFGDKNYGFNKVGKWSNKLNVYEKYSNKYIKATTKEVESMLIKEAEKRGFVNGTRFLGVQGADKDIIIEIGKSCAVEMNQYGLYCQDSYIFYKGEWATIVETPKEMTLEEIEKQLGHKVKIVS